MIKYRSLRLIRSGFIGIVLCLLVIAVGLNPERLAAPATKIRYQAVFADAGGLGVGNDVKISGVEVGSVSDIVLDRGTARVTFTVDSGVPLGAQSTAHIRTGTLLGERMLTLESHGAEPMHSMEVIPASRTSSPYALNEAIGDLTTNTKGTDTQSLNQSLDTLSTTLDEIAPQLGPTFDGLSRLSRSLNNRNAAISELLDHAGDITTILAQRSQEVSALILNGNDLLGVLVERRRAIAALLAETSALATNLSGLIAENEKQLAPALEKLNSVLAVLEKNRDQIGEALPSLAKFQSAFSEIVASGPFYNAYVPNLIPGQFLQPFLDYAFGFRRGTDAGQPPDDAGPRAELPFPYNGIPERPR
ncbi:MCE family protein [Mycobacterium sp. 236(2023)]|uniref:MCE family protein n=1 Tax=Mycobacterium sp. 236(2023) TaxID=3038163 RepID=UPI00241504AA|nr:MCE family protein [Mycobacterium sp. 236(2023)]MDG4669267.1 MCE family protein [Mycobacterium sp. 236(2023)]